MANYQVAAYLRLSKEDHKGKSESNSITAQRALLRKFAAENFSDYDLLEFCDDGYTGTNFERPGMRQMLECVKSSKVNCILVKDFSRFARDYIALGSYLEQIFPFMGVRFISVNDNYDSEAYQGRVTDIDINFKNLLYDLYSKDLSQKVRASLAVKKGQGKYVSANSPFGYEKDPKDRHALLVAEDEAEVVRRIFALTLEGYTSVEIARLFNQALVKTPIEFKIEKGRTSREPKGGKFLWGSSTICQILRNEVYIGNIAQNKYKKDFVGGKNHLTPREEWAISYSHHEPIIDREAFYKVQKMRGRKRGRQHMPSHPLTGMLVCGCCNKNLGILVLASIEEAWRRRPAPVSLVPNCRNPSRAVTVSEHGILIINPLWCKTNAALLNITPLFHGIPFAFPANFNLPLPINQYFIYIAVKHFL